MFIWGITRCLFAVSKDFIGKSGYDIRTVQVTTLQFGTEFPYLDYVRLKVTNGLAVVLPTLTVLTNRFDGTGRMIGSSRAPGIPVADLRPGQSAEVEYYPRGHLPGVKKITVEVEALISPEDATFFKELPQTEKTEW
jgi:hypothetical protein